MLRQRPELGERCCLLVEMFGRRVEFAAVNRGRVVFLRQVLVSAAPRDSSEAADSLISEIRRTRVVVANQENVKTVEPIVLFGDSPEDAALAERLGTEIGAEACVMDPLPESIIAAGAAAVAPEHRPGSAALVGALADEASGEPHALDFLHPRQPPKAASRRNTYVLAGVAARHVAAGADCDELDSNRRAEV